MAGGGLIQRYACAVFAALGVAFCFPGFAAAAEEDDIVVRFTLDGPINALSAPFLVALDKGYYEEAGLAVTIDAGTSSRESIARVASGSSQFALADINALIRFRDRSPQSGIKAVLMAQDIAPYAVIGRKSRNVSTVSDLAGKVLGATPQDTAFAMWREVARINEIDADQVPIESVGLALRAPLLAQGRVDAIFGSSVTTALDLKALGVPPEDVTVILLSKNGLDLYGSAVIVDAEFAQMNPDAVKGFVQATIRGFADVTGDPAGSLDQVLLRNRETSRAVEAKRLQAALSEIIVTDWVRANGFGGIDTERLARSIVQLATAYGLSGNVKAADIFTDTFLPPAGDRMIR